VLDEPVDEQQEALRGIFRCVEACVKECAEWANDPVFGIFDGHIVVTVGGGGERGR